jgi:hypothetical protein
LAGRHRDEDIKPSQLTSLETGVVIIHGTVNGHTIRIAIDSGSSISILSGHLISKCSDETILTRKPFKGAQPVDANGNPLTVQGQFDVNVQIGDTNILMRLVCIPDFPYDILLGNDVLGPSQTTIRYKGKDSYVEIFGSRVPFDIDGNYDRSVQILRTDVPILVPARSEVLTFVRTSLTDSYKEAILEGNTKLWARKGIAVACCLVTCAPEIPVRLFNPEDKDITLGRNTALGTLTIRNHTKVQVIKKLDLLANVKPAEPIGDPLNEIKLEKTNLSGGEKDKLMTFLRKNADLFATNPKNPGIANVTPHQIDTEGPPLHRHMYRLSQAEREHIVKEIKELLENQLIRPSASAWAAPVVLVGKKDGSIRFCIDYRRLNSVTKRDVYPIPRIDDLFDRLGRARFFSSIDLASGYWQIPIKEEDKEKTAFTSPIGLFEWNVMPFGLTNAPSTFQRAMDLVLGGLKWDSCLVYLDDIIVLSETFDQHLKHMEDVFSRLRKANFKLKASKCHFMEKEITYLGYLVSSDGIRPDPKKIQVVKDFPVPRKIRDIRGFLGLCNYYRRFVPNFMDIAKPLYELTKSDTKFRWHTKCQEAFDELRKKLTESPILAHPDFNKPFILETDASDTGISAILSQEGDFGKHVIAYASRILSITERKYSVTEREALAAVWGTKEYRPYLHGRKFTLVTDHAALKWLLAYRGISGRVSRWTMKMMEYDFEIQHRKGKDHTNADILSRIYEDVTPIFIVTADRLSQLQQVDLETKKLIDLVNENGPLEKDFKIVNGVLLHGG